MSLISQRNIFSSLFHFGLIGYASAVIINWDFNATDYIIITVLTVVVGCSMVIGFLHHYFPHHSPLGESKEVVENSITDSKIPICKATQARLLSDDPRLQAASYCPNCLLFSVGCTVSKHPFVAPQ